MSGQPVNMWSGTARLGPPLMLRPFAIGTAPKYCSQDSPLLTCDICGGTVELAALGRHDEWHAHVAAALGLPVIQG